MKFSSLSRFTAARYRKAAFSSAPMKKTLTARPFCLTSVFAAALSVVACQTAAGGGEQLPGNSTVDDGTDDLDGTPSSSGVDTDPPANGPVTEPASNTACDQAAPTADGWTYHTACADGPLPQLTKLFATPGGKVLGCTGVFEMWRSSDLGKTFEKTNADCREPVGQLPSGVLLLASQNGGLSYSENDADSFRDPAGEVPFVRGLTVHGDTAYALQTFEVLTTRDGSTFEPWANVQIEDASHILVDGGGRVHVFGAQAVVHRGTSNGLGWGEVALEGPTLAAVALPDGTLVRAGASNVFRSIDHGASWQPSEGITQALQFLTTSKGALIARTATAIHASTDGAKTFDQLVALTDVPLETLAILPDDRLVGSAADPARIYLSPPFTGASQSADPPTELAATCNNAELDGDEVSVDCGGSCAPCDDWEHLVGSGPSYVAEDGSWYRSGEGLERAALGEPWTELGDNKTILDDHAGVLYAVDYTLTPLYVSEDRGQTFVPHDAPLVPGYAELLSVGDTRIYVFDQSTDAVYSLDVGDAEWTLRKTVTEGSPFKFVRTSSDVYLLMLGVTGGNLWHASADDTTWTPVADWVAVDAVASADAVYAYVANVGIAQVKGDTATILPNTQDVTGRLAVNSRDVLFYQAQDGRFLTHSAASVTDTVVLGPIGESATNGWGLLDERLVFWPYVSRPLTQL